MLHKADNGLRGCGLAPPGSALAHGVHRCRQRTRTQIQDADLPQGRRVLVDPLFLPLICLQENPLHAAPNAGDRVVFLVCKWVMGLGQSRPGPRARQEGAIQCERGAGVRVWTNAQTRRRQAKPVGVGQLPQSALAVPQACRWARWGLVGSLLACFRRDCERGCAAAQNANCRIHGAGFRVQGAARAVP